MSVKVWLTDTRPKYYRRQGSKLGAAMIFGTMASLGVNFDDLI